VDPEPAPIEEEPGPLWIGPPLIPATERPPARLKLSLRAAIGPWTLAGLAIVIIGSGCILALLNVDLARPLLDTPPQPALRAEKAATFARGPVVEASAGSDAAAVLDELSERLTECRDLVPDELSKSRGYVDAHGLAVLPGYRDRQDRIKRAYATLLEIRERMFQRPKGGYVAYYFEEAGKGI